MSLEILQNPIATGALVLVIVAIFYLMFQTTISESKRTHIKKWEDPSVLARRSHLQKKQRSVRVAQILRPTDQERDPFPSRSPSHKEYPSLKIFERKGAPPLRVLQGGNKTASANR